MKTVKIALLFFILCISGCGLLCGCVSEDFWESQPAWDEMAGFILVHDFDSGLLTGKHYLHVPETNENVNWGIEAFTWGETSLVAPNLLNEFRLELSNGVMSLYGKNLTNKHFGVVRCVVGDVWNTASVPWSTPAPLLMDGTSVEIEFELLEESCNLLGSIWHDSWVMFAINLWFDSPDFPHGDSRTYHKPLVMDLVFYLSHTLYFDKAPTYPYVYKESQHAYHYQSLLGDYVINPTWTPWKINLQEHIQRAFDPSNIYINKSGTNSAPLPAEALASLRLCQVEFLLELQAGSGAASIRNFKMNIN